jgi:hypothetical protein
MNMNIIEFEEKIYMDKPCKCRRCQEERQEGESLAIGDILMNIGFVNMITCKLCGNKRCPHATDHRYACTNSNKPGQEGSIYG